MRANEEFSADLHGDWKREITGERRAQDPGGDEMSLQEALEAEVELILERFTDHWLAALHRLLGRGEVPQWSSY